MIKNGVTVACFGRRYREAVKQCSLQDRIWMKILQALPVLAVYCLSITMGAGGGFSGRYTRNKSTQHHYGSWRGILRQVHP